MTINKIVLFVSSAFGAGYIKHMPGTFGGLVGILLWVLFVPDMCAFQFLSLITISVVSILFSSWAEKIYGKKDDQRIVIDEVAGSWFAVAFLPKTFIFLFLGFLLFRVFDISKFWFIKNLQNVKGGLGVTIDDVVAGVFANVMLRFVLLVWSLLILQFLNI
ncbi:MAG: phosphatidylglycerophosphatase A [Endomicrobium sp.]|jgi:phosphatidylglycerophosphatase A|nr:phosphatidylglycerophosphatase A [Endomicrobium sp.]